MLRKKAASRPGSRKSWFWPEQNDEEINEFDSLPFPQCFSPEDQGTFKWGLFRPMTRNKKKQETSNKKPEDLTDAEKILLLRLPLVRLNQSYEDIFVHKFLLTTFAEDDPPFYFPWKFWYTDEKIPILESTVYRQSDFDSVLKNFQNRKTSTFYLMRELATPELCYTRVFFRIHRSYENQLFPMIASMAANGTLLQPRRLQGTYTRRKKLVIQDLYTDLSSDYWSGP